MKRTATTPLCRTSIFHSRSASVAAACGNNGKSYHDQFFAFGTLIDVTLVGTTRTEARPGDSRDGGAAHELGWRVERFLRDAKLYEIGAGTSEIRRMLIGRELFAETA